MKHHELYHELFPVTLDILERAVQMVLYTFMVNDYIDKVEKEFFKAQNNQSSAFDVSKLYQYALVILLQLHNADDVDDLKKKEQDYSLREFSEKEILERLQQFLNKNRTADEAAHFVQKAKFLRNEFQSFFEMAGKAAEERVQNNGAYWYNYFQLDQNGEQKEVKHVDGPIDLEKERKRRLRRSLLIKATRQARLEAEAKAKAEEAAAAAEQARLEAEAKAKAEAEVSPREAEAGDEVEADEQPEAEAEVEAAEPKKKMKKSSPKRSVSTA